MAEATTIESAPVMSASAAWRARLTELLLVGGGTIVLFPLAWLLRGAVGLDAAELAVGFLAFHAAYVINDPHFGVTYLLFYRDVKKRALGDVFAPVQRVRYWIAGFFVPVVLAAWALVALSLGSAPIMAALIQLMFVLVGWHYAKQGFGVLTVLSARRGVRFSPLERKVFLGHCFAGWAYAWASPADPGTVVDEQGVLFTTWARSPGLELVTGVIFALSAVLLVGVLVRKRRAEGRLPPIAALGGFLITIWLWTVFTSLDPLMMYVIPALHSVQYLYFVGLLERNEGREKEGPPAFGRPVGVRLGIVAISAIALGWVLLNGVPGALDSLLAAEATDSPKLVRRLGPTPYLAAFFAFVNIHHYFMDHVIWRRENPCTRYLRG